MDGDSLTYAELDALANQFAHVLRALGVAPEVLVGISAARSLEMVVGLLGVMKAGGAYVPIDPNLPLENKRFMVEEADLRVFLTHQWLTDGFSPDGARILYLDKDRDWIGAASPEPVSAATPENLAYVMYTCGATGKWKGVEITHRALVNCLTAMADRPGLGPDDVLVAVTTTSMDIAGLELYLPLISGGRVVLSTHEVATNPVRLADLFKRAGATVVQAPPATWRMLIDGGWQGRPGLKVLCGGEPLGPQLADELLAREVELWNMYGPTETTIWSTIFPVRDPEDPLSVGRPIANTTLYILDEERQPVPIGVPGKLHIGGHGLARGYLKHPELTAKRFIPHPFERDPEARIYRTRDLARYRPDGNVEFVGSYEGKFPRRVVFERGEETVYGALRGRLEGRLTGFFKRRPALQSD
jgi:amino acid adenylation domain-containing protein